MIAYPRWKIALVAIVLVLGILLAVPNLFGEENALQLARDRAAMLDSDRTAVEQILKDKGVAPDGAFLDQGRLTLRFSEERSRPPALAGVLACTGGGREWTAVCNGQLGELRDAAAGLGAEIVDRESPSLDEIFVARAGTPAADVREAE